MLEKLKELLHAMREDMANQEEDIIKQYGEGTGVREYAKGYISAISFIEGWLSDQEGE